MKTSLLFTTSLLLCVSGFSQYVGIGTTTPFTSLHVRNGESGAFPFVFSPLAVESNGHTYINLLSPAANETAILFGQPGSSADGVIMYNHTSTVNGFQFRNNGNLIRMVLNNSGSLGIGTINPQALLDVNGSTKTNSLTITTGGNQSDFLIKSNPDGQVSFRKGYMGLGINYIIAFEGTFPSESPPQAQGPMIGEIRIFSGNFAPSGWALCQGQLLLIEEYEFLFYVIGTTYGGDGVNNFALPDLRSTVPIGQGSDWYLGESN